MSDTGTTVQATIMYDDCLAMDYAELVRELERPFRNISLEFEQTATAPDTCAVFINETLVLRIGVAQTDDIQDLVDRSNRASGTRFSSDMIEAMVEDVQDTIEISVNNGPNGAVSRDLKRSVCYHVVRHLMNAPECSLIHWSDTDTLYVADEFDMPESMAGDIKKISRNKVVTSPRPETGTALVVPTAISPFGGAELSVADTHDRLDQQMLNAVRGVENTPHAGMEFEDEFILQSRATSDEDRLREARARMFDGDLLEPADSPRTNTDSTIGVLQQLSVYMMTLTILLLSFPIGFVMLIYNVIRGEDLTLTARVMALTGIGIGVTSNPAMTQALMFLA